MFVVFFARNEYKSCFKPGSMILDNKEDGLLVSVSTAKYLEINEALTLCPLCKL